MNLTPDYSIVVQVAIFLAVFIGLRRLVFDPVQRVLSEREQRTVQALHSAEAMIAAAHADRAHYEATVRQRRVEMAREAEAARHNAIEESNRQIAEARAAIGRDLAAHRAGVAAQVEAARRVLRAEAESIAAEMLQRVMGRSRA